MSKIQDIVDEVYINAKIPFRLDVDGQNESYVTPNYNSSERTVEKKFKVGDTKYSIYVDGIFSVATELIIYTVKEKASSFLKGRKSLILSLLKGDEIDEELLKISKIAKWQKFDLIKIYIEDNYKDIYEILKEGYSQLDIEIIALRDTVIIVGDLEEVEDHINSINETISENFANKYYISFSEVVDIHDLNRVNTKLQNKLQLAIKFNYKVGILDEGDLVLESIIDLIPEQNKADLARTFCGGFSQIDKEMLKTIEVFFKCGLNISDSSRELYIHRNTLLYRLDKIQRVTSYDLKDFNHAVVFKIILFIWKIYGKNYL